MTSNLYDCRSVATGQRYFPDETVNKSGPNHAPKTTPVSLLYPYAVKSDDLFLPRPELSKFSGDPLKFKLFISNFETHVESRFQDQKTFFFYLFNIVRIRSKKRYNIFLRQIKIVIDLLRITFLRNMARHESCQMSANKDSKNSLRFFQLMQRN